MISRIRAMFSVVARSPSSASAGSPGSRCTSANISTTTSIRVGTICASRPAMYEAEPMAAYASGLEMDAGEDVVAERYLDEVLDLLAEGHGIRDLEQEDHRRRLDVDLLHAPVERRALGIVHFRLALDEELLELGVAEAAAVRFIAREIGHERRDLARIVEVIGEQRRAHLIVVGLELGDAGCRVVMLDIQP